MIRLGRQTQVDARCAALGPIVKALAMSTPAEHIDHVPDPGYWAVEIRLADGTERGTRILCHAESNAKAFEMAVHLARANHDLRGFAFFWIAEDSLGEGDTQLPPSGAHAEISDPAAWHRVMRAHQDCAPMRPLEAGQQGHAFRITTGPGVWHVSRDHVWSGDYLTRGNAIRAAYAGARLDESRGLMAYVLEPPGAAHLPHHEPHLGA